MKMELPNFVANNPSWIENLKSNHSTMINIDALRKHIRELQREYNFEIKHIDCWDAPCRENGPC